MSSDPIKDLAAMKQAGQRFTDEQTRKSEAERQRQRPVSPPSAQQPAPQEPLEVRLARGELEMRQRLRNLAGSDIIEVERYHPISRLSGSFQEHIGTLNMSDVSKELEKYDRKAKDAQTVAFNKTPEGRRRMAEFERDKRQHPEKYRVLPGP